MMSTIKRNDLVIGIFNMAIEYKTIPHKAQNFNDTNRPIVTL